MIKKIEPYKGVSNIYDEIRPSYPDKLIRDIISKTNLKLCDKLLEIGPGTGKATIQFAEKGFAIHGVEIGEDMAEIFRNKCTDYPKVSIDVASFEDWSCPGSEKYDMIYCAQAFHWLDTNIKYKKCYNLLKDNGYLVLFWYNPCEDGSDISKEIEEKIEEIVEKYSDNYSIDRGKPERRIHSGVSTDDERKTEIEASGLFELIEKIEYKQEKRNNAEQCIKAKKSIPEFNSILDRLEEETIKKMEGEIEEVINRHGGYVDTLFNYSLYITKKLTSNKEPDRI